MKPEKIALIAVIPLIILMIAVIAIPNFNLYVTSSSFHTSDFRFDAIIRQLAFLRKSIDNGGADHMQAIYPEGYFFLHAVYGLTWSELALMSTDAEIRKKALQESAWALATIESPKGYEIFDTDIEPKYGVFYVGWVNYLRARIIALTGIRNASDTLAAKFINDCILLGGLFDKTDYPYLPSIDENGWPGDNIIAMHTLRLHDELFGPRYTNTIANWIIKVERHLDATSGMPPFEVHCPTRGIEKHSRGSAQALFVKYVSRLDSDFAKRQYALFRNAFFTTKLGIPLIREYPKGTTGPGDYDSGPVIWDIGATATIVALGTMRSYNDTAIARALEQGIEMLGFPVETKNSKRYAFGIMPMGDAFLSWSKTAMPAIDLTDKTKIGKQWRIYFQMISMGLLLGIGGIVAVVVRKMAARPRYG